MALGKLQLLPTLACPLLGEHLTAATALQKLCSFIEAYLPACDDSLYIGLCGPPQVRLSGGTAGC